MSALVAPILPFPSSPPQVAPTPLRTRITELQKTVSASRLGLWQKCRLQFYFRYVRQIQKPPTAALHTGSVIHLVLQAWNKARWRGDRTDVEGFKTLFHQKWIAEQEGRPVEWKDNETAEKEQAWRMVETYLAETPIPPDEKPEAVEVSLEVDLGNHGLPVLIGFIDLVRSGGRIVDFKTSAKTPDSGKAAHQHETQLACYSVLYRDATGRPEVGLELHHLVKTKTPKVVVTALEPMGEVQRYRLFRLMESYQNGLERGDFIPSPGIHCAACEYFTECRAWKGRKEQDGTLL